MYVVGLYPTEGLYLLNVIAQHWRLLSLVKAIELWDVVHLDIVSDTVPKAVSIVS